MQWLRDAPAASAEILTALEASNPVPPNPDTPQEIGSNSGIMWGTNIHPIQGGSPYASMPIDVQFQLAQDLGLRRIRFDLYDASQQSQTMLASVMAEGNVRNVEVLPIIIPNFKNYLHEQAAYNDCVTLMREYADNFPQVMVWELGNEFELASQISGQGSFISDYNYDLYTKARGCYRGMIDGMKGVNPRMLSCIDTSGHGHWGWTDELWKDGVKWDITGEHFYSENGAVDIRHLYLEVGETDKLALLKEHYGKPIWMTEFNYWYPDNETQFDKTPMAQYLSKTMAQYDGFARDYGLEAVDIYEELDQPQIHGREGKFGLYTNNQPNAAGEAVKSYLATHPSKIYKGHI
jgi:hypothetical protein